MTTDTRKSWKYQNCQVDPIKENGPGGRYFGNPNYPRNKTQYRTRYWKCSFMCGGFCFFGTKNEVKSFLDNPRNGRYTHVAEPFYH